MRSVELLRSKLNTRSVLREAGAIHCEGNPGGATGGACFTPTQAVSSRPDNMSVAVRTHEGATRLNALLLRSGATLRSLIRQSLPDAGVSCVNPWIIRVLVARGRSSASSCMRKSPGTSLYVPVCDICHTPSFSVRGKYHNYDHIELA